MATTSKRSQVSKLDTIKSNTPVARGVDTFVSYRPPAKKTGASDLIQALSSFAPQVGKYAQANRDKQELVEKNTLEKEFVLNPDATMKKFMAGGFKDTMTPTQVLAGEHVGKALARQWKSRVTAEYAKSTLKGSDDPTAFRKWVEGQRSAFINDNKDSFAKTGVVAGFSTLFRSYEDNLNSEFESLARENLKTKHETNFKTDVSGSIDAVLGGQLTPQLFGKQLKLSQSDAKTGYAFDNITANKLTLDAIVDYASDDPDLTYAQRLKVLKLANNVETTKGNFLGNTQESQLTLGKARVAIDRAEEQRLDRIYSVTTRSKSIVKDNAQSKIQEVLSSKPSTKFSEVFDSKALKIALENYPEIREYYERQKAFFNGVAQTVDDKDLVNMRVELSSAEDTAKARAMIEGWQKDRLKNNAAAFNTLWAQADKIDTVKGSNKNFSQDVFYKGFARQLGGVDPVTGLSIYATTDPRNAVITQFMIDFQDLFYTEAYQKLGELQKRNEVQALFTPAFNAIKNANKPKKKEEGGNTENDPAISVIVPPAKP